MLSFLLSAVSVDTFDVMMDIVKDNNPNKYDNNDQIKVFLLLLL